METREQAERPRVPAPLVLTVGDDDARQKPERVEVKQETPRPQTDAETNKQEEPRPQQERPARPAAWKLARITLDEFRRRYFLEGNRPRRSDVKRWIEVGTAEGRVLPANLLDGRYYIQVAAAEAFLTSTRAKTDRNAPKARTARPDWHDRKTAAELRTMGFSFM